MSDDIDETTQLKYAEERDDAPKYANLKGEHKSLSVGNHEEYITFDFMVTVSASVLHTANNLQHAIGESVDCELDQIQDLKITEIDDGARTRTSRVNGKIYTDDWELPMLEKKFQKIISDRVLSGNLQRIAQLEDRPMIRRFFCKTSREQHKQERKQSRNGDLAALNTTASLRTEKNVNKPGNIEATVSKEPAPIASANQSASYSEQSANAGGNANHDRERNEGTPHTANSPEENCDCFCVVL
eukprot:CAMPEP_0197056244 /NCGR_PEP_ID=MMETSP1384-20130603/81159_1 /TAXON_ID=29189 /ORGANISM="Ammonia sp." /LENGTH=242 /DNA_ID=CAMNT_0042490147 /DNA_START=58 /DNA_END=786 /DNA_ORIENTATION=-